MQFLLFRKEQKIHHHILSGLLVSLVAVHMAFGIDHMLAASEKMSKKVVLKVSKSGEGVVQSTAEGQISCGKQCTATLEAGSQVTLVARAAAGFYVKGWSASECRPTRGVRVAADDNRPATSICTVNLRNSSRNVSVVFARVPKSAPVERPTVSGENPPPVACKMDAKVCADGTTVGRTGPKCEFVCPASGSGNRLNKVEKVDPRGETPVAGGIVACKMDAKVCADGTTVGRTGPKCEFVCPTPRENPLTRSPREQSAKGSEVVDWYTPNDK